MSTANNPTPPNGERPSIDQRLEKLAERHEALTQSVELLLRSQQRTDKELKRVGRYIRGLAMIALSHEARLGKLEGNMPDQDEDETEE